MNVSSNTEDKSWDHPWTTDEIREHRNDWSLAGDVGLLKHLQQFSETLTERVKKTQSTLDSLSNDLNDTTILVDNITNASLALANTQFIESKVHEDDLDQEEVKKTDDEPEKVMNEAEMIALLSENIKKGLKIMDEKYERLEVVGSDDSDDENETSTPSFILRPKDPYQNRPLPYVIGSEKWKSSSKIGLESSSSDSDAIEEEESDQEQETNNKIMDHIFKSNIHPSAATRSISSSESSDFNEKSITNKQYSGPSSHTDKLYTRSQDTLNSTSEITTPSAELPKNDSSVKAAPDFAAELAKRLGSVLPKSQKSVPDNYDTDQSSINRSKDDLFTQNDDNEDDIFNSKSVRGLFDDEVSNSLWKDKIVKKPASTVIPPSLDQPPPINTIETKPKSAIDDLFGDYDSEDSDDIFAPSSSIKATSIKSNIVNTHNKPKNNNIDTINEGITPELNDNIPNLFKDDEDDDETLFTPSQNKTTKNTQSGRPPGLLVSKSDLLSSSLGNKLFQRAQKESTDSSENESVETKYDTHKCDNNTNLRDNNTSLTLKSNLSGNKMEGIIRDNSSISSIQPSVTTLHSLSEGSGAHETVSTRESDKLFHEKVTSDSLLNVKTVQNESVNSVNNYNPDNQSEKIVIKEKDGKLEDNNNLFNDNNIVVNVDVDIDDEDDDDDDDDDDVFRPPPLPKTKTKNKSKVNSLFDDSDSGDDLFSNTSSGSHSQKSSDILSNNSSYSTVNKSKTIKKRGLFDKDIFSSESNLKKEHFVSKISQVSSDTSSYKVSKVSSTQENNNTVKRFSPSSIVTTKSSSQLSQSTVKPISIFDDSEEEKDKDNNDDDDDDLFGTKISTKPWYEEGNNSLFSDLSKGRSKDVVQVAPKKDSMMQEEEQKGEKEVKGNEETISQVKTELKPNSDQLLASNKPSSNTIHSKSNLFSDSDDENDSLFNEKVSKSQSKKDAFNSSDEQLNSAQENSTIDSEMNSKVEKPLASGNIIPPKTFPKGLTVQLPSVTSDDLISAPKRAVSGKIKNLMGKMGDLKIMSPTDTPLLWRKTGEKTESSEDNTPDQDSEDGCSFSVPSSKTSSSISKEPVSKSEMVHSPTIETETAVSFDTPAQVETLEVTTSKSRVRIPVKRRPQSRQARQTALRNSGIDFDIVDSIDQSSLDLNTDRLISSNDDLKVKLIKPILNLTSDDKSEISLSKEHSMSTTKNTLLSPSTDEEDLFDVPPDLPEDPQKEDSLFGRAPILSPVQNHRLKLYDEDDDTSKTELLFETDDKTDSFARQSVAEKVSKDEKLNEKVDSPKDPLRDKNHDPLKDPSQLFPFVTRTSSPEKRQNLLFTEDDNLFSQNDNNQIDNEKTKKSFNFFADDDTDGDLFSGPFTKTIKKPGGNNITNLFDDIVSDDDDNKSDDLFRSASSKKSDVSENFDNDNQFLNNSPKKSENFDDELYFDASEKLSLDLGDDDDDKLFKKSNKIVKNKLEDIFGDNSTGEDDDIFSVKKPSITSSKNSSSNLFFSNDNDDDDDSNDLFNIKKPTTSGETERTTRDLKKTSGKIGEDPLSMLQDD